MIVEEGWPHGGVGANLAALIQEQAFDDLDAPVARVTGADLPMPYSKPLEQIAYPHEPQIVEAVLATFRTSRSGRTAVCSSAASSASPAMNGQIVTTGRSREIRCHSRSTASMPSRCSARDRRAARTRGR